ncbi:ParB N-terminal domain-containing protein [Catalinimonas niigatensis]|uniref:ParB N-terminal domain-containing protein n=1 Tax=Catalinimonas niigatensis TaxID=1397264 RepID=UPI0026664A47|nr:ParB N-terminal domain-containing protein [Catalinimonas niigatensis]WPP50797.1 ParB N-terminal domain-containing protein [Catalinimonas niigatensis]
MEASLLNEIQVLSDNGKTKSIQFDDIKVKSELQNFITPLSEDSREQLEENIKLNGCLDPLTLWDKKNGDLVLVDGHNRYQICSKHDIPFRVRIIKFGSEEEAKDWMINHQLGRRNLNPDQLSYFRGLKYERMKKKRGGYDKVLSSGQSGDKTSEVLAREFNVSDRTILRDAEFAKGIEIIAKGNPQMKNDILLGRIKVKKSDVQTLAQVKDLRQIGRIKNEADLYNKAKSIRKEKEAQKAEKVQGEVDQRINDAIETIKGNEPVFTNKEDRIKRLKANIVSSVNKTIQHKDKSALREAKAYLKRLEDELFGKYANA